MISKNDCYLILLQLQKEDIEVDSMIDKLSTSNTIPLEVLEFINKVRPLELTGFYEKIRKSYNNKKSNLYINIMKEIEDTNNVLTTLSAMATQILLFSKQCKDRQMFLRHSRLNEIYLVLLNYCKTFDLIPCIQLLKVIKTDIKALESFKTKN